MKPEEGYKTARALLKSRYGQSYKIANSLVNRLTKAPQIKADDGPALRRYSVMLTSCKNALKEIGYLSKIENPDTLMKIVEKLPFGLRQKWRDRADTITEEWSREVTIEDIADFVELKARAANHPVFGNIYQIETRSSAANSDSRRRQKMKIPTSPKGSTFATQGNPRTESRGVVSNTPSRPTVICPLCEADHFLSRCETFIKARPVSERLKFTRKKGLCDNCLRPGHVAASCPKESFCRVANCQLKHRKHSTFLHPTDTGTSTGETTEALGEVPSNNPQTQEPSSHGRNCFVEAEEGVCNATGAGATVTGLANVPVRVKAKGKEKVAEVYAFLDPGSNISFCTEELVKRLEASGKRTALTLTTMNAENVTSECTMVSLEVCDLRGNNTIELNEVFSRSKLPVAAADIPLQEDVERWPHLKGIKLPSIDAEISLLIGNNVPKALEPKEVSQSDSGGPYAVRTALGWTINGPLGRIGPATRSANRIQTNVPDLDTQFKKFYEMEFNHSQFSTQKTRSQEDKRAFAMMESSTKFSDGHYEIGLPWKVSLPRLPNNKALAERRLQLLKRRLTRDPDLRKKYLAFMDDLFEKGYTRRVPVDQLCLSNTRAWYLPHHPVVHPQKPDKIRVVFDCAATFQDTSLNQQLLQGPDLTNSLVGVLTRFRSEETAVMADVEKMFYQVRVPNEDSKYLRFLWWPGDLCRDSEEFQMLVHLFGGVSSPSCANYGLLKTANDNEEDFDEVTIQTVRRNFYVDDCLKSTDGDVQAVRLVDQLRKLLAKGGFRLTKWISNSPVVIQSVPGSERAGSVKELSLDHLPVERALGMRWDVQSDTFRFKIVVKDRPPTRRGILSIVSSIYDPLGFVAPLILTAKAILRELCWKALSWDDQIPPEDLTKWQTWLEELPKIEQLGVQRCLKPRGFGRVVSSQLYNFSDASQEGYGAVSYLRVTNTDGNIHCAFLIGTSRQTPLKSVSIPRLELSAAVVATGLSAMMLGELDSAPDEVFYWTDSTCVLSYIVNRDRRFQTFVANRIATIHEASQTKQWKYVDTKSNPADDVSRGLPAEAFVQSTRWINGPDFLWKEVEQWPKQPTTKNVEDNDPEIKREVKASAAVKTNEVDPVDRIIQSCSSW